MAKLLSVLLFVLMTACAPAYADEHHDTTYDDYPYIPLSSPLYWGVFYIPVENEEHFAVIRYRNTTQHTEDHFHTFTFETPYGDVRVFLFLTPNDACKDDNCPDTVYVLDVPLGVSAEPMEISTDEQGNKEIKLFPYSGF